VLRLDAPLTAAAAGAGAPLVELVENVLHRPPMARWPVWPAPPLPGRPAGGSPARVAMAKLNSRARARRHRAIFRR
jgi:hypothetical protein